LEECAGDGTADTLRFAGQQRYRETERIEELKEASRRPRRIPRQTNAEWEQRILEERQRRPDWGARKLRVLLEREGIQVPVCTIHRILRRHDLIKPRNQHRPALKRFQREQPNQLWQMDFKGLPENLANNCTPLSIIDDCSRFVLGLEALSGTKGGPVRQTLERIFRQDGVPEAILMDHGTPWWVIAQPLGMDAVINLADEAGH
jgi:transposase InsO family protein